MERKGFNINISTVLNTQQINQQGHSEQEEVLYF
jgi:hypothetical protein